MVENSKTEESGTPAKYLLTKLEEAHNCYSDLKNNWEQNAKEKSNELQRFVCTSIVIFLLGFLLSQVSMYLFKNPVQVISEEKNQINYVVSKVILEESAEEFIDYASSNNGGSILPEFSTPEYLGWFSIISNNKRESLISDINEPGNCWPFNGSYGYIGIQLAQRIYPRHFSVFHINSINYSSAPKSMNVYSLDHPTETIMIASYFFDLTIKGEKRKNWGVFECQSNCDLPLKNVLLEITDNYGGSGSCVYQFRVHGIPQI
jgi:Sad1 / UNC-like C-terminal